MAKGRERTFNAVHMDVFNPMLADGKYTYVDAGFEIPPIAPPNDDDKERDVTNKDFVDWVKKK